MRLLPRDARIRILVTVSCIISFAHADKPTSKFPGCMTSSVLRNPRRVVDQTGITRAAVRGIVEATQRYHTLDIIVERLNGTSP